MKVLWIDLETCSLDICYTGIVQLAINYKGKSQVILLNPEMYIEPQASNVHHIYEDDIKDCPTFKDIAPKLLNMINDCDFIGGYNHSAFDIPILYANFSRVGIQMPKKNLLDVYKMVQMHEGSKKLKDVYRRYTGEELIGAHDAGADVTGTIKIYEYLTKNKL